MSTIDIRGRTPKVGDEVVYTRRVWDNLTQLQLAEITNVGDESIEVKYIESSHIYSEETQSHSIPVYTTETDKRVKFYVVLDSLITYKVNNDEGDLIGRP